MMNASQTLSVMALRTLVGGACRAVGIHTGAEAAGAVIHFLAARFSDQSQRLSQALQQANERAWRAFELALAGDSFWDRCKLMLAPGEERAFREQVRAFLDVTPFADQAVLHSRADCLRELQAARKAGLLIGGSFDAARLAQEVGGFASFADPEVLLQTEAQALDQVADELRQAGYSHLAGLVGIRPKGGGGVPLLVLSVRYFFRRAVEDDTQLFQGLAFARLEDLQQTTDQAFAGLSQALTEHASRLDKLLGEVQIVVVQTRDAVLDIQQEQSRQGEQNREIYRVVLDLQGRLDLVHRELRPRDSLSIRGDAERDMIRAVVARYRALPEDRRKQLPALLNAIGKLEVAAGDFREAQQDFAAVATLVGDDPARAEAHTNAYRAALERRDWATALAELDQAVRLDGARFAPFPLDKYRPLRILGAGGFGVAFLCRHQYMNAEVVVKALTGDDLDRPAEQVFAEAHVLRQLDHPAIIRLQDCGFADPARKARPYLVMDYFEGTTLEEHVRQSPLVGDDLLAVAQAMAAGLLAAHGKGILHRDVKPANLLVRKEAVGERRGSSPPAGAWQIKLIDFGLALRQNALRNTLASGKTLQGSSIAGTLDYAAPEQLGKLSGRPVGFSADVYGFGRTCCYALFQTPQPLLRHWRSLPPPLAELLESCLEELPENRPADFQAVLAQLAPLHKESSPARAAVAAPPPVKPPQPAPPKPGPARAVAVPPPPSLSIQQRRQELAVLSQRVRACTRCDVLARNRTQTVFGTGPLDAAICFLAEAPGADEDREGQPFVGAAGKVLDKLLSACHLRRDEVYLCNILKCRPPGNRAPFASEASNCKEFLEKQLELVRPKVICALGSCAAQNLLDTKESIGRLRGRWHDYRGTPVLCTYHPAFLLPGRSPEKRVEVMEDLRLILKRVGRIAPD